jgi:hypothetical protein
MIARWLSKLEEEERKRYFDFVKNDLKEGGKLFGTRVINKDSPIKLDEWEKYILESEKNASEGKILVSC